MIDKSLSKVVVAIYEGQRSKGIEEECIEVLCHVFIHSFDIDSANILGGNYYVPSPLLIVIDARHRQAQS